MKSNVFHGENPEEWEYLGWRRVTCGYFIIEHRFSSNDVVNSFIKLHYSNHIPNVGTSHI